MGDAQIRATHKASIERIFRYVNAPEIEDADLQDLEIRLERLQSLFKAFSEQHFEIVRDTIDTDLEAVKLNADIYADTEDLMLLIKANLCRRIMHLKNPPNVRDVLAQQHGPVLREQQRTLNEDQENDDVQSFHSINGSRLSIHHHSSAIEEDDDNRSFVTTSQHPRQFPDLRETLNSRHADSDGHSNTGLKLEAQTLPMFNGDYTQWLNFRDIFIRLVHGNRRWSSLAKFNALSNHLTGEAASHIAGIQKCDENYQIAWEILVSNYNNERLITNALLKLLKRLKPMTTESLPSLQYIVLKFKQVVGQLEHLGIDIQTCDLFISFELCELLDPITRRDWEMKHTTNKSLPLADLFAFLDRRLASLRMIARTSNNASGNRTSTPTNNNNSNSSQYHGNKLQSVVRAVNQVAVNPRAVNQKAAKRRAGRCGACPGDHETEKCDVLLGMNPYPRLQKVKSSLLCYGCLSSSHSIEACAVPICTLCDKGKRHHRILCFDNCDREREAALKNTLVGNVTLRPAAAPLPDIGNESGVLLGTALLKIKSTNGEYQLARALIDSGAQANLITEDCVRRLKLKREPSIIAINPVSSLSGIKTNGIACIQMRPTCNTSEESDDLSTNALIMKRIAVVMPDKLVNIGEWPDHVTNKLADTTLRKPGRIDILLGAHIWSRIVMNGIERNNSTSLVAQFSKFGWIISGGLGSGNNEFVGYVGTHNEENRELVDSLNRFWSLEKVNESKIRSKEEQACEDLFMKEHYRNENGRYVVPIPLKGDNSLLGNSYNRAYAQFRAMESKFCRNPVFREQYVRFMNDFIIQGHMTEFNQTIAKNEAHFYAPHHGIDNGKFRVVFSGAAITTSGQSFNDIQMTGERLQDNLNDIILRFRLFKIALNADIKQMYRQVLIDPAYRQLQLVLWRDTFNKPLKTYSLNTVTYGMKYASHSAVRALRQLAIDSRNQYPNASSVTLSSFYMDDLVVSVDTEDEAFELQHELQLMMESCGFDLRKWSSNSWSFSSEFDTESGNANPLLFAPEGDNVHSVLGVTWNQQSDQFQYVVKIENETENVTKRSITSIIAKFFDPTGMLSPVIVRGKIFIRDCWIKQLDWDQQIAGEFLNRWREFHSTLKQLENIRIPRWIFASKTLNFDLHCFCDASNAAYSAVVYYRIAAKDGLIRSGILSAKTKVAPKKILTIPKLELSGALLLTRLVTSIKSAFGNKVDKITYWTDSTIVLSWINTEAHRLKVFVANRIAEIQEATEQCDWKYISTSINPADIASRGCDATELIDNELWWYGPDFLSLPENNWPSSKFDLSEQAKNDVKAEIKTEERNNQQNPLVAVVSTENDMLFCEKFDNFTKLCAVTAYAMRFIAKCKKSVESRKLNSAAYKKRAQGVKLVWPVNVDELIHAENTWLIKLQALEFADEVKACIKGKNLNKGSKLLSAAPFIDLNGILRVGGRLVNANISYDEKHPIILPGKHFVTKLIINMHHLDKGHGGVQLTTRSVRERYWIIGGRNAIRQVVFGCVTCTRYRKDATAKQKMAPLVENRVNVERPFTHVSLDYCGPFEVKRYAGRCKSMMKVYVAVFICMSTRAIHLQMVTDLTTEAFLDAFQGFIARRGCCKSITSDNATNFLGAKGKLDKVLAEWQKCIKLESFLKHKVKWNFIMPRSPHQGGSHESAVKLFKDRWRRIVGSNRLAVLEFNSLVVRIEGILNSRPLSMQYEDVQDELAITPAHFLNAYPVSDAVTDPPIDENQTLGSKWRLIQYLHQQFWKKWHMDYINNLQLRHKWQVERENIQAGDVVLIREENYPPQHWCFGKVLEVHPDKEGNVRNVTLQRKDAVVKRAIQRVVKLPVEKPVTQQSIL